MAKNIQSKLSGTDNLKVFDINIQSSERFLNEAKSLGEAAVAVAANAHDAAQNSVSLQGTPSIFFPFSLMNHLSMNLLIKFVLKYRYLNFHQSRKIFDFSH